MHLGMVNCRYTEFFYNIDRLVRGMFEFLDHCQY